MLKNIIHDYKPSCMQETNDKQVILKYMDTFDNLLNRENEFTHFTASAFIVNKTHDKVLMAYHNIYKTYAWLGGHADGDSDLLQVAIKEANEESGITNLKLLVHEPISLDVLSVRGHIKQGKWITPHIHLNITYLFEASDTDKIRIKEDENSSIKWISIQNLDNMTKDDDSKLIYFKILDKLKVIESTN